MAYINFNAHIGLVTAYVTVYIYLSKPGKTLLNLQLYVSLANLINVAQDM